MAWIFIYGIVCDLHNIVLCTHSHYLEATCTYPIVLLSVVPCNSFIVSGAFHTCVMNPVHLSLGLCLAVVTSSLLSSMASQTIKKTI